MSRTPKKIPGIENRQHAGGSWTFRVRWKDPVSGRRLGEEFDDQEDAIDFKAELRRARRSGRLGELSAGRELLKDFVARSWWPIHAVVTLERKTLTGYASVWNRHLLPRVGHLELRQITARAVAQLRADLEADGVGAPTIVRALTVLQSIMRTAAVWGHISASPVSAVKKPSMPRSAVRPPAPITIERIVEYLVGIGDAHGPTIVYLCGYEGLRPEEALALQRLHCGTGTLLVERKNVDGRILPYQKVRGKRPRPVDLLEPVSRHLQERFDTLDLAPEDLIISREDGTPWRTADVDNWRRNRWQPACVAVDIGEITIRRDRGGKRRRIYRGSVPYWLRHAAGSMRLLDGRLSPAEIAEQQGHSLRTFLETYAHVIAELRGQSRVPVEEQIRHARQELRSEKPTATTEKRPQSAPDEARTLQTPTAKAQQTPLKRKRPAEADRFQGGEIRAPNGVSGSPQEPRKQRPRGRAETP